MSTARLFKLGLTLALISMSAILIVAAGVAVYVLFPGTETGQTPVAEAGGMWFAWLHNPRDDSFLRVYEDGTTEAHTLPLSPGERMGSSPRAFAPGGELIAMCTFTEGSNRSSPDLSVKRVAWHRTRRLSAQRMLALAN